MHLGDRRNSHADCAKDNKMNLGGPSESVCRKYQAGYIPDSGIIGSVSHAFIELVWDSNVSHLIETEGLIVTPCAYANDGTA